MIAKSKRGCLSQLLFVIAVCYLFFVIFSHGKSSSTDPIPWSDALSTLAWLLGLSVFFKIISPRRKGVETSSADFTVDVRSVGSSDVSASPRQLEYIKALGGKPKKNMTLAEASRLIDELKIEHDIKQREEVKRRLKEHENN